MEILDRFGGYPNLEQLWALVDEPWIDLGCDPRMMDDRVGAFYRHPVWLLNGLMTEHHPSSRDNRSKFSAWIVDQKPRRVVDFGGGFGGLARRVGAALPSVEIEVVEPHPHPAAVALAAATPNVRYVPELSGVYDIMIATDVFEHVPDPIGLAASTARNLRIGGQYLIANCFAPAVLCHLPQLFHLSISWDAVMQAMGLRPEERVVYGRSYRHSGIVDEQAARAKGECSRQIYPLVSWLPRGKVRIGKTLMQTLCRSTYTWGK